AGIFPPLKDAVSGLLECAMNLQIAEQNQAEYDRLALDLVDLVQTLQKHLPESRPRWTPYSIENAARSIGEQVTHAKQRQDRSKIRQIVQALDGETDVLRCYRRVEHVFRQLQMDISLSIWDLTHEQWVDTRLKDLAPVHEARYNAGLSVKIERHGCTPDTRVKILEEAMDWTHNLDAAKIYWMNGMAGTGKTTIAYSLCERLEESKQLGACFFCSRSLPDCRDVNRIVPTIAYQLGRFSNPYQKELCEVLSNNPDVSKREISIQFAKLIVGPLLKVKGAIPDDVIIVIDALDECSDTQGTQRVLDLLFSQATSLPVKFFVTSRPEPGISSKVQSSEEAYRLVLHLHEVETSLVQADIQTYLERELRPIKAQPEDIKQLTARAGCLFIYAATVVRYIEPQNRAANHRNRLATIISAHPGIGEDTYQELDQLYSSILSQALEYVRGEERELLRLSLRTVIGAREPLTIASLAEMTNNESEEAVQLALLPLHSVLRVSDDTKLWDLRSGTTVGKPLVQHRDWVRSVDFSPDGSRVVSGSYDTSACVWDVETCTLVLTLTGHTCGITAAMFTPDGQKVVTCSADQTLLLWDASTGAIISGPWEGHSHWDWDVDISPDSTMVVSGSEDHSVGLWDIHTGALRASLLRGHTGAVYSVAFSPDGKHVISGSLDGTMRIWDAASVGDMKEETTSNWVVSDEGWVMDPQSKPVLWLPLNSRARFVMAPCLSVIPPDGIICTNLDEVMFGDRWGDCYVPFPKYHMPNV
ncbi:unnamed protein product, partial [Rhizoctonia solani]